jgi:hypothetical protein
LLFVLERRLRASREVSSSSEEVPGFLHTSVFLSFPVDLFCLSRLVFCFSIGVGPQKAKNIGEELFATIYAFLEQADLLHLFPYAENHPPSIAESAIWRNPQSEEAREERERGQAGGGEQARHRSSAFTPAAPATGGLLQTTLTQLTQSGAKRAAAAAALGQPLSPAADSGTKRLFSAARTEDDGERGGAAPKRPNTGSATASSVESTAAFNPFAVPKARQQQQQKQQQQQQQQQQQEEQMREEKGSQDSEGGDEFYFPPTQPDDDDEGGVVNCLDYMA